jgi:hypothetical protein
MEYAVLFSLMGTWIFYRELCLVSLKRNFKESLNLIDVLLTEKLGEKEMGSEGVIEIKVHKIKD